MATGLYSEEIQIEKEKLQAFIQSKEEWAELIPGYLHHEFPNEQDMIWVFQGDFGIIQKTVKVELKYKESPTNQVMFDLIGLSDPINGDVFFEIREGHGDTCKLTGNLTMKASGFLAGMMNPILEKFVPQLVEKLVQKMVAKASL